MDDFDHWNEVKKKLHRKGNCPPIKDGEVWWCGIGRNLGVEINGKSGQFSRPVVIMRKISHHSFMGVP
ncbi:MAG: hypothetical protein Q4A25_01890 [Candidatus Saccharibacteria bacterium]|nr:hypothetical protein [Candidatus Saccharibacteria bacterium]